jgi:glycerophosphoryl diester phosphodiesterase
MKLMTQPTRAWTLFYLAISLGVVLAVSKSDSSAANRPSDQMTIIAHAMGGIEGKTYTNSLEAFLLNYALGTRIFEVDVLLTKDRRLVAVHDNPMLERFGIDTTIDQVTEQEFLELKILPDFTTLSLKSILELMTSYPDIEIVIDFKQNFESAIIVVVETAETVNPNLLKRIIPQVYNPSNLQFALRTHPFEKIIYHTGDSLENAFNAAVQYKNIWGLSMSSRAFSDVHATLLKQMGVHALVYTLNDPKRIAAFEKLGATGVYSDFFTGYMPASPEPGSSQQYRQ